MHLRNCPGPASRPGNLSPGWSAHPWSTHLWLRTLPPPRTGQSAPSRRAKEHSSRAIRVGVPRCAGPGIGSQFVTSADLRQCASIRRYLESESGCLRCKGRGRFVRILLRAGRVTWTVSALEAGASPLFAAVFRTKRLLRERCAATCQRRRRPGQARRRQGWLQITPVLCCRRSLIIKWRHDTYEVVQRSARRQIARAFGYRAEVSRAYG